MEVSQRDREGLSFLRIILVLSSFAPLFILWAVKGVDFLPAWYFEIACSILAIVPSLILFCRESIAKAQEDTRPLVVGEVEDHRGHILVYLFATLLPFYGQDVCNLKELIALFLALVFIVFLFWHLNLHYINILFALRGYHIFMVHSRQQESEHADIGNYILITRRRGLPIGLRIVGLRITNSVYLEVTNEN